MKRYMPNASLVPFGEFIPLRFRAGDVGRIV